MNKGGTSTSPRGSTFPSLSEVHRTKSFLQNHIFIEKAADSRHVRAAQGASIKFSKDSKIQKKFEALIFRLGSKMMIRQKNCLAASLLMYRKEEDGTVKKGILHERLRVPKWMADYNSGEYTYKDEIKEMIYQDELERIQTRMHSKREKLQVLTCQLQYWEEWRDQAIICQKLSNSRNPDQAKQGHDVAKQLIKVFRENFPLREDCDCTNISACRHIVVSKIEALKRWKLIQNETSLLLTEKYQAFSTSIKISRGHTEDYLLKALHRLLNNLILKFKRSRCNRADLVIYSQRKACNECKLRVEEMGHLVEQKLEAKTKILYISNDDDASSCGAKYTVEDVASTISLSHCSALCLHVHSGTRGIEKISEKKCGRYYVADSFRSIVRNVKIFFQDLYSCLAGPGNTLENSTRETFWSGNLYDSNLRENFLVISREKRSRKKTPSNNAEVADDNAVDGNTSFFGGDLMKTGEETGKFCRL